MTIAEQEEKLFDEWQKVRKPFVRDGVVCGEAYLASKRKTAFVLREYPGKPDGIYDLRENELKNPCRHWRKVAEIQHGICEMDLPEEERRKFDGRMPPSICAFNLDKAGGHSTTNRERLALIAMRDSTFINRQFEIYAPDLTICGGTFQIFRYVMGHEYIPVKATRRANLRLPWYERRPRQHVVGINHTASRGRGFQSPEDIIEAIKKIYQLNRS